MVKSGFNKVPCNGCTICCHSDAIRLLEGDDVSFYMTVKHPYIKDALMLAHKENGECIYLEETGCGIHDYAPLLCRQADCRSIALKIGFEKAIHLHEQGIINFNVWDKGRMLLTELAKRKDKNKR